jgi:hypothetical protein
MMVERRLEADHVARKIDVDDRAVIRCTATE